MFKSPLAYFKILLLLVVIFSSQLVSAQATRTWVSGVGDDVNPCSRTAPCKTFAGAISKTAAGGEINVIDSGGFGAVTITKSITIDGAALMASILASGTNAIIVNASATDVVTIRGIHMQGLSATASPGLNGIRFINGKELHVENCVIENFRGIGIDAQNPTANNALFVRDTIIRNVIDPINGGGGILVKPVGVAATVSLDNVRFDQNNFGMRIEANTKAMVRNSLASNTSPGNGFVVFSSSGAAEMFIENSSVSNGAQSGILSNGSAAKIYLSNTTIFGNPQGLVSSGGGQIISFGNNKNAGNTTPGVPTLTIGQQ
ncbi:MAG: right-handed parallel beta-helix repeat-containing protein [Pseudomonadota bacterium]